MRFAHQTLAQRVVFATGEAELAVESEVEALGCSRVMLIASTRDDAGVASIAARLPVAVRHTEVVRHVPVEVAERARGVAACHDVDALVAVGGGSATGLAKAVALTTGLPVLAVPTTYAGSEATDVWGLTQHGHKQTGVSRRVLPTSVVYDADLLASLPRGLAVASGLNALAHGIDALWGPRTDPIDQALAEEGIRALHTGLTAPGIASIEQTLYGAYLCAVAFASAGSGLHHKICHVLGGLFDLPHAQTHAAVLPHVLALNAPSAPAAERRIAQALASPSAVSGLIDLRDRLQAPRALRELGMPHAGIPDAVEAILAVVPVGNPVPVTADNTTALLQAAWSGEDPS